jgi:glycosyltransferase involved in cell wall biosynthesis
MPEPGHSPRIGIDGRALLAPKRTGVENYTHLLVRHMARIEGAPEILLYVDRRARPAFPLPETIRLRVVEARVGWLRVALPLAVLRDGVQVMHFPYTVIPRWVPCRKVVTVYDLASEYYPEAYSPADLKMQRYALRRCAPRADRVIAISQSVRDDLLRFSRVRAERIEVIRGAADERFFEPPADSGPPLGLKPGYVLFVGNLVPRKNLGTLIDAYAEARTLGVTGALVIAGTGRPEQEGQLRRRAASLGVSEHLKLPGYVDPAHLPALYGHALALVWVSLYEGFGMPPLEAGACGTPVIASNVSCFPEVLGDAAILVDPHDAHAVAAAIASLATDPQRRAQMAARIRARAREFSWDETARRTLDLYLRVAR